MTEPDTKPDGMTDEQREKQARAEAESHAWQSTLVQGALFFGTLFAAGAMSSREGLLPKVGGVAILAIGLWAFWLSVRLSERAEPKQNRHQR